MDKNQVTYAKSLLSLSMSTGESQFPCSDTYKICRIIAHKNALFVRIVGKIYHMVGETGYFAFSDMDNSFKFFAE